MNVLTTTFLDNRGRNRDQQAVSVMHVKCHPENAIHLRGASSVSPEYE